MKDGSNIRAGQASQSVSQGARLSEEVLRGCSCGGGVLQGSAQVRKACSRGHSRVQRAFTWARSFPECTFAWVKKCSRGRCQKKVFQRPLREWNVPEAARVSKACPEATRMSDSLWESVGPEEWGKTSNNFGLKQDSSLAFTYLF